MLRDGKVPKQTLLRMLRGVDASEFDGVVWGAEHLSSAQVLKDSHEGQLESAQTRAVQKELEGELPCTQAKCKPAIHQ